MKKRYQYLSKDGIKWTDWFECYNNKILIQYKTSKLLLKNEYKI